MRQRYGSIDAGRALCCVAIVLIHSASALHFCHESSSCHLNRIYFDNGQIIDQLSRFAVPYFFVASGYFAYEKLDLGPSAVCKNLARRILPAYAFWCIIYNVIFPLHYSVYSLDFWLRVVLQGGSAPHLWYLPSVFGWVVAFAAICKLCTVRTVWSISLLIYFFGLLFGSYFAVAVARPPSDFQLHIVRSLCFGPVFICTGIWARASNWKPSHLWSLLIFFIAAVLQILEDYLLVKASALSNFCNDFTMSTLLFGVSAFFVASRSPDSRSGYTLLASLGRLALGVYCVHWLFIRIVSAIWTPIYLSDRLALAIIVIGLSFGVIWAVEKIKIFNLFIK